MSTDADLLTPADLAERLKLTEAQVMHLNRLNEWPHVRFGRRIRFTPAQVERIVAAQSVTPKKKATAAPKIDGQTSRSARSAS